MLFYARGHALTGDDSSTNWLGGSVAEHPVCAGVKRRLRVLEFELRRIWLDLDLENLEQRK